MPISDADIVRRVRAGDTNAYGLLVERYQGRLTAAARHLLGDEELALDAVQEAFIEGFRHLEQCRDTTRVGGWLYGILRHRAHGLLEHRSPTISWDEEMADNWYVPPECERSLDLPELLALLPLADREALAARYLLDLSYDEVAAMLGTSAQNARVRVCRAKERLRVLLHTTEREA